MMSCLVCPFPQVTSLHLILGPFLTFSSTYFYVKITKYNSALLLKVTLVMTPCLVCPFPQVTILIIAHSTIFCENQIRALAAF